MTTRLAHLEQLAKLATELRQCQRHYERDPSHALRLEAKTLERALDTALYELHALRWEDHPTPTLGVKPQGGDSGVGG